MDPKRKSLPAYYHYNHIFQMSALLVAWHTVEILLMMLMMVITNDSIEVKTHMQALTNIPI